MRNNKNRFILLIVFILACWFLGRYFKLDLEYYRNFLSQFPLALSGLLFIAIYVFTTTFVWFGPKDILRLSSAILFGGTISTVFVTIAELFNATILFYLSRKLGRGYIKQKFKVKDALLDQAKKDSGFFGIIAFRLNLLFPLRFIDLGYGLTHIHFKKYLILSILSTPFRIFLQQYIMAVVGEKLITDVAYTIKMVQEDSFIMTYSLGYFIVLVIVTLTALILRTLRKRKSATRHEG